MSMVSGEWALRENRIEAVACMLPTLDHTMDGMHIVQALGHDGMTVNIGVNTDESRSDPDHSATVQMVYLARLLRDCRRAEMQAA
jgi:hypothetical protein